MGGENEFTERFEAAIRERIMGIERHNVFLHIQSSLVDYEDSILHLLRYIIVDMTLLAWILAAAAQAHPFILSFSYCPSSTVQLHVF